MVNELSHPLPEIRSPLDEILPNAVIAPASEADIAAARARLDSLAKPVGSLGRLEECAIRLFAASGGERPLRVDPALAVTVAGDHGAAEEGISPFPQAVTRQMVASFLSGGGAVNVLSRAAGMEFLLVDAGCAGGPFPEHDRLLSCRLGDGTANFARGPAMSRDQAVEGLRHGAHIAAHYASAGIRCLAVGEMGIGNTTAAAALACALFGLDPDVMVGPGTGAGPEMIRRKADVVRRALEANAEACSPERAAADPVSVLAAMGGFEIAVMAGIMLGAAACRRPVLVDGFISSAACAVALKICPALADHVFLSHLGAEPGHAAMLDAMGLHPPLLRLGMRLGEGTGAVTALPILRAAAAVFNDMATLESAGVSGRTDGA